MAVAKQETYSPQEYLAFEERSSNRHEYWNGEIYAMSGGTARHNRITLNLTGGLDRVIARRKRPCTVYGTDLRLRIKKANVYTYPDVMVICGKLEYDGGREDTVLNPALIIEVLSDSTEKFDRTQKFAAYQHVASLQEYILVDQSRVYVECFRRGENSLWTLQMYDSLKQVIKFESLGVELSLRSIYAQIQLPKRLALVRRK